LNACPINVAYGYNCLDNTTWLTNTSIPLSIKVSITKRWAKTVFDRYEYTILDVTLSDTWQPANYTRDNFTLFFDAIFTIRLDEQGYNTSTQLDFLVLTYRYFVSRINSTETQGADEGLSKLRSLFAAQMLVFNNVNYGQGPIPDDLGKTISLAKVSYRVPFLSISAYFEVIIPLYTALIFALFAVFMCIWCLVVLAGCLFVQTLDWSYFP
jgi:hypothetical protein